MDKVKAFDPDLCGAVIARMREGAKMDPPTLAGLIGVPTDVLLSWEAGRGRPISSEEVARICGIFQTSSRVFHEGLPDDWDGSSSLSTALDA